MTLWPLAMYAVLALAVVGGMLALSYVLGERHAAPATGEPFESGVVTTGTARVQFPAHFYLVALFFVIFDLEVIFLFAWAIAARDVGWFGYVEVLIFVGVLLAALAYLWRDGALDWGTSRLLERERAVATRRRRGESAERAQEQFR